MNVTQAVARLSEVIRRKHLAWETEETYCGWLQRYCAYVKRLPAELPSEEKIERFLTRLAKLNVSASTQNQAFNSLIFFYKEALGVELKNIRALRAKKAVHVRNAPTREEVLLLMKTVQGDGRFAIGLVVRLLYGCGLRVTEPLNLRIKDVNLESGHLTIRAAKGGKDRVVAIPCSVSEDLRQQMESARIVWKHDQLAQMPVVLPGQLANKYPHAQFDWKWAWVFPANEPCLHPRTGKLVRWRLHEANIQRAVRSACRKKGLFILPHELRHAYATHCLNRGANPRAIQEAMGHKSLETTMGYLHAEALSVASPLDR
ncbi:MAG: integron integrase [Limisphaerales bacterium]